MLAITGGCCVCVCVLFIQAPIEQVQARTDSLMADVKQMREAIQDLVKTNTVMAEMIRDLAARKASPPPATEVPAAAATDASEETVVSNI